MKKTKREKQRRLPNGNVTQNVREYLNSWRAVAFPMEKALGWTLIGFDPDFQFEIGKDRTIALPLDVVKAISRISTDRNDACSVIKSAMATLKAGIPSRRK